MKKIIMALPIIAALGACTPSMPIETAPTDVTYTQKVAAQGIIKFAAATFRTKIYDEKGQKQELAGVKCDLQGSGFKASFVTPSVVRIPMRPGKPGPVIVTCTDGERTRTQPVHAINVTAQNIQNSAGAAGGLLGALVAVAVTASRDTSKDVYDFRGATIFLNSKP